MIVEFAIIMYFIKCLIVMKETILYYGLLFCVICGFYLFLLFSGQVF